MSSAAIAPLEITALAKIMDELDYYQLLDVKVDATTAEIRQAYYASSRTFHPDANRSLPTDLRTQCVRISKRITEAYCVLRDARRRKAYDAKKADGSELRIQLAEARTAHDERRKAERRGSTAQGRQYHGKAEADLKAGNLAGAIQNIQMAMTFEPNNVGFKALLEELRGRQKAAS